jgi:hypothetical protein
MVSAAEGYEMSMAARAGKRWWSGWTSLDVERLRIEARPPRPDAVAIGGAQVETRARFPVLYWLCPMPVSCTLWSSAV